MTPAIQLYVIIIRVFEKMSNWGFALIIIYKRLERYIVRPLGGQIFEGAKKDLAFGNQRAPNEGRKQSIFHPKARWNKPFEYGSKNIFW